MLSSQEEKRTGTIEASFFVKMYLFMFRLCRGSAAVCGLSIVVASGGYSLLWYAGFSLWWLFLLLSTGARLTGFSCYSTWAQWLQLPGTRAHAQQLWHTGLVGPQHVGSSWIRDQTCVSCTGRQILPTKPSRKSCF